ncbi:MAG: GtrA family protein [Lachnospiraceae bacterium]|nr:GtrA family protein [Lachnospiraceae bacterium]
MTDKKHSIKRKELFRTIKFVLFSASAGIIELGSFTLLDLFTPWPYWPKYLVALTLSVLWNFTLNRQFTFQSANNVPVAMFKVACYYAVFTPVTTIGGNFLAETLGWNDVLVTILNMALNLVTEYLYDRFLVFGKTIDTNERAQKKKES